MTYYTADKSQFTYIVRRPNMIGEWGEGVLSGLNVFKYSIKIIILFLFKIQIAKLMKYEQS